MRNVCLVGVGYWGKHLCRNLSEIGCLHSIVDTDKKIVSQAKKKYSLNTSYPNIEEAILDKEIDAFVISAPPKFHYQIATKALTARKHVLIEKPFTLSSKDASKLANLAKKNKLTLMAGFTFLYNEAVRKIKEFIESGELGEVFYIFTQRLNFGIVRSDVDVNWNLAPHDISIILYLFDQMPTEIRTQGISQLKKGVLDIAFTSLKFKKNLTAYIHSSWINPTKTRGATIVGTRKMLVYDDTSLDSKIKIYDRGFGKKGKNSLNFEDFIQFQLLNKEGNVFTPEINFEEPLRIECEHFIDCINEKENCLSNPKKAIQVLKILEAMDKSASKNGTPVKLR